MRIVNKIITYVELGASYAIASEVQYRYETGDQCIRVPLSTLCEIGTEFVKQDSELRISSTDSNDIEEVVAILDLENTMEGAKWIESATDGRIKIDLDANAMYLKVEDCYEFYKERSVDLLVDFIKNFKNKK